ncbi:MAG: hypothetical protein RL204_89 [Bacteroidota bacterium]|jgi:predicted  nucleic acid-binding Zn-ribbon protein
MSTHTLYHISHVTAEYADWMRAISFYQDEIKILKNRLSEVSQRYTNTDVKVEVEHFQNQFIIQNNNLEDLLKDIKTHESHMSADAEKLAQHLSNHTLAEHDSMRDRFTNLEKVITSLRHDFNKFLCRYM